jgi:transcriptional regulator with XRE-family HTH domain
MPLLTPETCRAARGLVNWSQSRLAAAAKVSLSTVKTFELGKSTPITNNLEGMQRALEDGGVEFIAENGGGVGVRLGTLALESSGRSGSTGRATMDGGHHD